MELKNFDKLVQAITSNILEKLEVKTTNSVHEKSCLIVVPNIGFGMKDYYSYIEHEFPKYNLYVGKDKGLSNIQYGGNNLVNFVDLDFTNDEFVSVLETVDTVIVVGLRISQMNALIELDDSLDVNHVILGSLMASKPVTLLLNSNQAMYQKISAKITNMKQMGVTVVNIQNQINTNGTTIKTNNLEANQLITESYVASLGKNGSRVIILNKKQLITPLAKDKLRELKIEVKYVKEDNQ